MKIPEKQRFLGKCDPKLKIAIAREYLSTDQGYKSLSKKYHIPKTSIIGFVAWYKEKYQAGVSHIDTSHSESHAVPNESDLKINALKLLIENASKELGLIL